MALEEGLIGGDVLDADDRVSAQRCHLVNQLHRIAMRQELTDTVYIHHRLLVGIIERRLHLMLTDFLSHETCKLVVNRVTRTRGNDPSLDGFADQRHISDNIKQLMTGTLIVPLQGLVLNITKVGGIAMLYMQHVSQHVETLLCGLTLIDDDGIVEVTAFDKVGL